MLQSIININRHRHTRRKIIRKHSRHPHTQKVLVDLLRHGIMNLTIIYIASNIDLLLLLICLSMSSHTSKVTLSLLRLNRCTDFNLWYRDTLTLDEGHRLLLTAITDVQTGRAALG